MTIIKHGKSNNIQSTVRFDCRVCGCAFLANKPEFVLYYSTVFHETDAHTTCPECGATCITFDVHVNDKQED